MGSKLTMGDINARSLKFKVEEFDKFGKAETEKNKKWTVKPRKGNNSKRPKKRK